MSLAPNSQIGVLVVDDSPFMRLTIQKILSQEPGIKVLDTARDGREGIEKLQSLRPQVVTMDVEMPVMTGLQALEEIMRWQPTPIIMLSSLTTEGAEATLKAFDLGAFDVVAKPSGGLGADLKVLSFELIEKIKAASGINPNRLNRKGFSSVNSHVEKGQKIASGFGSNKIDKPKENPRTDKTGNTGNTGELKNIGNTVSSGVSSGSSDNQKRTERIINYAFPKHPIEIVAIGTSTGGPSALQAVLPQLPADFPVPVIVAQHMPPGFTGPLAQRLNGICSLEVREGKNGEVLKAGTIIVAPAGKQMQVVRKSGQLILDIGDESPISTLYHPSVDVMFLSLAKDVGKGTLGVVMTGMGNDGVRGMKEIKAAGGFAIAEAEESCVVYGMPRAIIEAGLADRIPSLGDIGRNIVQCVQRRQ